MRWLAVPVVAALIAASCGGDDDDGGTGADGTGGATAGDTGTAGGTATGSETGTAGGTATGTGTGTGTATVSETSDTGGGGGGGGGEGLTPVPEGVDLDASIKMSYSVAFQSLDPDLSRTAGDNTYMWMMYDRLTEIDEDLEVVPMLATEWAYSDDGTTFTMQLRDDVQFHDGTPFDADAVVANIDRTLTVEGSATAAQLDGVESVEATGPYEVTFHLPEARPSNLPVLLAGNPGAMLSPAWIADPSYDLSTETGDAGSGPYRAVEVRPLQGVSYVRAEDFWDPGRQLAAEFSIDLVDPAARINGVRSGEFDLGQSAATDSSQAIELGESGAFNYYPKVINTVYGALFNAAASGSVGNLQFRQAIRYALDLDAMNEGLFEGRCEPRWQSFPEGSKYFFPEIEELFPHDPDKARELVEESGVDPEFSIEVSPGSYEPFSQVMQAQLAEVGITMNIVPAETSAVPTDFITGKADAIYLVVLAHPDPASLWANWFGGPFSNMVPESLPETAAIRTAAAAINDASLSQDEQIAAWKDVYTQVAELATFIPGCAAPQVWMSNPSVIGVEEMPYIWSGSVVPYTIGKLAG